MLSISEAEIDWCFSILSALFESVQWTVTARHRSAPPLLLYKHLIPWFQHSILGFSIMALAYRCNLILCEKIQQQLYSITVAFVNSWWPDFHEKCVKYCVFFGICTSMHYTPVGIWVCVCIFLNARLSVCVRLYLIVVGQNELRNTEMLSAACAVGVGCCFAAPIGGKTTWLQPLIEWYLIMVRWLWEIIRWGEHLPRKQESACQSWSVHPSNCWTPGAVFCISATVGHVTLYYTIIHVAGRLTLFEATFSLTPLSSQKMSLDQHFEIKKKRLLAKLTSYDAPTWQKK